MLGGTAWLAPAPLGARQVAAEDRAPASECCLVLLLPVGARSIALGRALTAIASPDAAFANPAGLAGVEGGHLMVHHTDVAAQGNAFSLLFDPGGLGTIGLSYELVDFGEIEHTDDRGQTVGVITLRHHVLLTSFATQLAGWLDAGMSYKFYQFRIGCRGTCGGEEVTATTHAVDLGVRVHPVRLPAFHFGAAVTNVGFPLQVINAQQADPLPVRVRVGAAYELLHHLREQEGVELWWAVDVVDEWREPGAPQLSTGVELSLGEAIFLRSGYVPGEGIGTGAAIGIGIDYDRFTVSVARSFASSPLEAVEEPMQFSFGLRF
ncbi:MAG TPA: PorV/PorQ family protein [Longimicrobiales bacterium]